MTDLSPFAGPSRREPAGNVVMADRENGTVILNQSDVSTRSVYDALVGPHPEIAALIRWTVQTAPDNQALRQGGIFQRDRYVVPGQMFAQFRLCQDAAVNDDVVSNFLDTTEALAFGNMNFESTEEDEENIWNQVAYDIDLPSRIREMWRELCTVSQFYTVTWWGKKDYKVQGENPQTGVKRKKGFSQITVPLGLTILDPVKVVPVGNLMFNQEQLCLPADTRVWTANGPVRMEDLEVGERVWSWGEEGLIYSPVVRKVRTGTKPILRIRTLNHDLRVSPDHPVLCFDGVEGVWKRAAEIGKGDVLVGVQKFNEDVQVGLAPSPEEAFVLGLAIGDGKRNERIGMSAPSSDERFWTFVEKSEQSDCWLWTGMQHVRGYGLFRAKRQVLAHRYAWTVRYGRPAGRLRNACGTNNCVNPDHWQESKSKSSTVAVERYAGRMNTQFDLYPACDQTQEWVQKVQAALGCETKVWNYGTGCDQIRFLHKGLAEWAAFQRDACTVKRAPAWVWSAARDVRLAFLRGFLAADGHNPPARPNEWSWGLGNRALSEDMRMLAVSVGWSARSVRPVVHPLGVTWDGAALESTTRNQIPNSFRRNRHMELDGALLARTVISVDVEPAEPVWDIEVSGPHTFVAEGVIVHNCYIADRTEVDMLDAAVLNDPQADQISRQIIVAKYAPPDYERRNLARHGINAEFLYTLNPRNVWRHTVTRPQYRRFAEIRMLAIMELLDLKNQLRQMDRAHLIGGSLRTDQRVVTPDGWKTIGSLRVGDEVYGVDGKPTEVIGVFPQGVLDLWRVTFSDGAEVICDGNHYWTVTDRDRVRRGSASRTITLNQIMAEGLWKSNGPGKRTARHRIPISAPWEFPDADLPVDPYLLGYLIGNGGLTSGTPSVTITPGDERCWEECLPVGVWPVLSEHRPGAAPSFYLSSGGSWKRRNPLTVALEGLGLMGHDASGKFIPERYLWSSVEQRWALLQGLCDSDGHSHLAGGVEYSTVSEKLADGVIQLAQSLGGLGRATVVAAHDNEQTLYRVWVSLHQEEAPFRLRRKVARWQPRKVPYVRAIERVERVEDAEAVCIKVARDDGLFVTEAGLVTHNTNFIVLIRKGTDHLPARPEEVQNLQAQVQTVARLPILVGDHRLSVDIVTPKTDFTLDPNKYSTIDNRLLARLYQQFIIHGGEGTPRADDALKLGKTIARGMEARRSMLKRTLERQVFGPAVAANPGVLLAQPELVFHPARIEMDFDPAMVQFTMDLRQAGEISRRSALSLIDLDEEREAMWRRREAKNYDGVFTPVNVPFSAPGPGHNVGVGPGGKPKTTDEGVATPGAGLPAAPNTVVPHSHGPDGTPTALPVGRTARKSAKPKQDPKSAGRTQGGNRNGGGAAPGTGQGQAPRRGRPQ